MKGIEYYTARPRKEEENIPGPDFMLNLWEFLWWKTGGSALARKETLKSEY